MIGSCFVDWISNTVLSPLRMSGMGTAEETVLPASSSAIESWGSQTEPDSPTSPENNQLGLKHHSHTNS